MAFDGDEGVRTDEVRIDAADGFSLAADVTRPAGAVTRGVLIAPAMGVKRGFYRAFARHLAEAGALVVCADYRGIGGSRPGASLRGFQATLQDWADLDLAAVLRWLHAEAAGAPLSWVGHSVGGQLFGLLGETPVERALLVGAQSGHWRLWRGRWRAGMFTLWHTMPLLVGVAGRLPMKALGQGEDVPAGVALEWARWGRDREYILPTARRRPRHAGFGTFTGALEVYAIADDAYAPPPSVEALAAAYERASPKRLVHLVPADVGLPALGHFAPFKPSSKAALWDRWRDYLVA